MSTTTGVPVGVRKCPLHKSWILGVRTRINGDDNIHRYCEQCEKAKPKEDAPPENKPKIRIGSL